MPTYRITINKVQDDAVAFKANQLKKTKDQIFQDLVVDGLISAWIREMLDADINPIRGKWDSLTTAQKDQIKIVAGI